MPILPNEMGRPSGRLPPIDLKRWYPDPDADLTVQIMVTRIPIVADLRDLHWKLFWVVKTEEKGGVKHVYRRLLEVVQEIGYNYLTNWGAITQVETHNSHRNKPRKAVTTMSLSQRQELERIAAGVRVEEPNGEWNCQDWIITVLKKAEQAGLVTNNEWTAAVAWARKGGEE
ncbi:uncharacterized protein EV420DRAFT_812674 [Desarmillaria tabescens]|uniref:Uncharacterized protein n=1 Tax=Armillaria tabescens TaxID=1929756 RepID=A0AA39NII0_ARMTA|nr:uncharacterized protein EV420DRAFT_812674 [Desarmillaria tabescens]KAK0466159.1 hypothetical protein EV420DRAFT_812674 [Desarmillaria tabescens]